MASGTRAKRSRTGLDAPPPPALTAGSSALHQDRDWTSLPSGTAGLIAEHLLSNDVADYVCFRAACSAWRACCADPRAHAVGDRRFHPRRWIMLPRAYSYRRRRCFLNISTGECVHARIPDPRSNYLLGSTAEGLLVVCRKVTDVVQLFNPLTGQLTDLPKAHTMVRWRRERPTISRLRSSGLDSAGIAGDSTVAILYDDSTTLAVAKPGDEQWTRLFVDHYKYGKVMASLLPYAGRLYCITPNKILVVVEAAAEQKWPRLEAVPLGRYELELEEGRSSSDWWMYPAYDVDEGNLMFVHRSTTREPDDSEKYTTYRAQLDTGSVVRMQGLGGQALFLSGGRSQSVPARVSSPIRADTVYVCNDSVDGEKKRPEVVAVDLLDGSAAECNFDKNAIADALWSYVCVHKPAQIHTK